jgi:putative ABC transport system permease protein
MRSSSAKAHYVLRAELKSEPDRGVQAFFGPRVLIALESLAATGLVQPGSLVYRHYRLALTDPLEAKNLADTLKEQFPDAAWRIRRLDEAAPGLQRFVTRTELYLALVALSALLVGGLGVAHAITAWLETRIETIATLKSLGADRGMVFRIYLLQAGRLCAAGDCARPAHRHRAAVFGGRTVGREAGHRYSGDPLSIAARAGIGVRRADGGALHPRTLGPGCSHCSFHAVSRSRRPRSGAAIRSFADRLGGAGSDAGRPPHCDGLPIAVSPSALWSGLWRSADLPTGRGGDEPGRPGMPRSCRTHRGGWRWPTSIVRDRQPPVSSCLLALASPVLTVVLLVEESLRKEIERTLPAAAPTFYFIDLQPDQREEFRRLVTSLARGLRLR